MSLFNTLQRSELNWQYPKLVNAILVDLYACSPHMVNRKHY